MSAGCWDLHLNSSATACLNKNSQVQAITALACFAQSKEPATLMRAALFKLLFKITTQKDVAALKSLNSQQTWPSEGSLCYCLLTGHWATDICLRSLGKSVAEAGTRGRPSVVSMDLSSGRFP